MEYMCMNERETCVAVKKEGDVMKVDEFKYLKSAIKTNRQGTRGWSRWR